MLEIFFKQRYFVNNASVDRGETLYKKIIDVEINAEFFGYTYVLQIKIVFPVQFFKVRH